MTERLVVLPPEGKAMTDVSSDKPPTGGQPVKLGNSALFERPPCRICGAKTLLARREPHPTLGPQFELDTFECPVCRRTQTQDARSDS